MEAVSIPPQLIGHAAFTVAFVLVAWAILREASRWLVRALVLGGIIVGIAVALGLLDNTQAGAVLYWTGSKIGQGVTAAATWLADTWQGVTGAGEPGAG